MMFSFAAVTYTTYTYNLANLATSLTNKNGAGTTLSSFAYTYSADGNILSETDHNGAFTNYTYDMLGRLVSEIGTSGSRYYTYDNAGNRVGAIVDTTTTISYTYNTDGSLAYEISNNGTTSETTTYSYDLNGNLVSKSTPLSTTNYTYNVWGNMTSGAGATYGYNAQNLRTYKIVGSETDNFVLVGGNVWSDGDADYFRGIELISNGTQLYLYNIRGDVIQLTDLSGNVVKTYDYDAYGNELQRDLNDENPFRYCGEYYDTETGFIYLRARYYDPMVGRFTSIDPIKDRLNWYVYCADNPVLYADKNGLFFDTVFDLVSLGFSVYDVIKNPDDFWAWAGLVGDVIDLVPGVSGVGEVTKTLGAANDARKVFAKMGDAFDSIYDTLKHLNGDELLEKIANGKLVSSYKNLKKLTSGKNLGAEVHHLIEKRFASALGIENADDILSIVISDKGKHQKITAAFRDIIGYAKDKGKKWTTSNATPDAIWEAIVEVYKKNEMQEYLSALKDYILEFAEYAKDITNWRDV